VSHGRSISAAPAAADAPDADCMASELPKFTCQTPLKDGMIMYYNAVKATGATCECYARCHVPIVQHIRY
jgi:hypothetical protein